MSPNTINIIANESHFQNNSTTQMEMTVKKKLRWYETETEIIWSNVVFIIALHTIGIYYLMTFPYSKHKFLVLWGIITTHFTGLGITAGAHRLWAHRTYKAKIPLRIFLAICHYSTGQNSIFNWVRDHRLHHKYTDTDADPHDSTRGFWFSHVGWLMMKKKDQVRRCGNGIDMSDILEDPVVQFFDRNSIVSSTLFTIVLPVFIPVYFFNQDLKWTFISHIFIQYPYMLNVIWSVNSFAHMFGYHSYDKSIRPTENIYVSLTSGGEGWHNYHHVFPWDYKAAEFKGFVLNVTTFWIDMFEKMGLAYDLKYASPEHIQKVVEKNGDGTHCSNANKVSDKSLS